MFQPSPAPSPRGEGEPAPRTVTKTTLIDTRDLSIDARAVNSREARELYRKREQIHPKLAHGTFRNLKWAAMVVLLAIYYITPWLRWARGDARPE